MVLHVGYRHLWRCVRAQRALLCILQQGLDLLLHIVVVAARSRKYETPRLLPRLLQRKMVKYVSSAILFFAAPSFSSFVFSIFRLLSFFATVDIIFFFRILRISGISENCFIFILELMVVDSLAETSSQTFQDCCHHRI